jgi:hypothetical protein
LYAGLDYVLELLVNIRERVEVEHGAVPSGNIDAQEIQPATPPHRRIFHAASPSASVELGRYVVIRLFARS